jgi:hypothetical protein
MILAECNKVHLLWALGHKGVEGNEITDHLARRGSLHPVIGPGPACGISERVGGHAIREWVNREHHKYWQSISGQKHAKGFLDGLSVKRIAEFLKLSRVQGIQVGLLSIIRTLSLKGTPLQTGESK